MANRDRYPRLLLFVGPTGAGKSASAEAAAESSGCPIVVLDRFQVFPELRVGTGRDDSPVRPGKHFLENRPVAAGELSAVEALEKVRRILRFLRSDCQEVILEGGSTSLIASLMKDADVAAAISRVQMVDREPEPHIHAIVSRVHRMLDPSAASMIDEADRAWPVAPNRSFVSSICGYDAIAAVCDEVGCRPGALAAEEIAKRVFPRIVSAHLAYAARQRFIFGKLFPRQATAVRDIAMMATP